MTSDEIVHRLAVHFGHAIEEEFINCRDEMAQDGVSVTRDQIFEAIRRLGPERQKYFPRLIAIFGPSNDNLA